MGGVPSSGGKQSGTSGEPSADADPCDIAFRTNLFGPVPDVVESLGVSDKLDVLLLSQDDIASVAVFTREESPRQAGTITGALQLGDLVMCLQEGHHYEAEVESISGSMVRLRIYRV